MLALAALRKDYNEKWASLQLRPEWLDEIDDACGRILHGRTRYEVIETQSNVPWWIIGLIHELESGCRFSRHLHNGDPLTRRTQNKPEGRPAEGHPPFSFEVSALDALWVDHLTDWTDWSIAGISYKLEGFNGFGYRAKGKAKIAGDNRPIPSPYLYSGSFWYTKGKFYTDGPAGYGPNVVSKQVGALVILKALCKAGGFEIEVR